MTSTDMVNSPAHYKQGDGIECIDAIRAQLNDDEFIGFLRGNVIKYGWRLRTKGKPVQDAEKMRWYQERLIDELIKYDAKQKEKAVTLNGNTYTDSVEPSVAEDEYIIRFDAVETPFDFDPLIHRIRKLREEGKIRFVTVS